MAEDRVQIFAERPVSSGLGVIKLGMGLFLGGAVVVGLARGTGQGDVLLWCSLAALGLAGAGIYDLGRASDRRAQVVLTAQGFQTRAMADGMVPWAAVARVEAITTVGTTVVIRFHLRSDIALPAGIQGPVVVDPSPLARAPALIAEGVRRFAPQVPLEGFVG